MKTVILAGGLGSRLKPLTLSQPKPLVSVGHASVIEGVLRVLYHNSITQASVTTMYMADKIKQALGEVCEGVRLKYFNETTPLGTAGGVREALEGDFGGDVLVVSGDCVFDFDLKAAMERHAASRAACTILLTRSPAPLEYGVVLTDPQGKVTDFVEKPPWSAVFSERINSGIYIISGEMFSLFEKGVFFDFSNHLFPLMMNSGYDINTYVAQGYWCDVGNIASYYKSNEDMLEGKLWQFPTIRRDGFISSSITENTKIAPDCEIKKSILTDCSVGQGAYIENSVIGKNTSIGEGSRIETSIIADNVSIGKKAIIEENCVIGSGAVIGEGARVREGETVEPGRKIMREGLYMWGRNFFIRAESLLSAGRVPPMDIDAALRLGICISSVLGGKIALVSDESSDELFSGIVACGLRYGGADCVEAGKGNRALASFAALRLGIPAVYVENTRDGGFCLFNSEGLPPSRDTERKITALFMGQSQAKRQPSGLHQKFEGLELLYSVSLAEILGSAEFDEKIKLRISGEGSEPLASLFTDRGIVCANEGDISFTLSQKGTRVQMEIKDKKYDFFHLAALAISRERDISFIPYSFPRIFDEIARSTGGTVSRYVTTPINSDQEKSRRGAKGQRWFYDGAAMAAKVMSILYSLNSDIKALCAALDSLPIFATLNTELPVGEAQSVGEIMRRLCKEGKIPAVGEGIDIIHDGGRIHICPCEGRRLRVITEAVSTEAARDLCDIAAKKIKG